MRPTTIRFLLYKQLLNGLMGMGVQLEMWQCG